MVLSEVFAQDSESQSFYNFIGCVVLLSFWIIRLIIRGNLYPCIINSDHQLEVRPDSKIKSAINSILRLQLKNICF